MALGVGTVIHWKDYVFANGNVADKYLVILGCKTGSNYLAILGTSQPWRYPTTHGCHASKGCFCLDAKKDWFPKKTWLILSDPVELSPAEYLKRGFDKQVTTEGSLRIETANAIRNCLKLCEDVSADQLSLL